jgi:hypothetical protein
MPVMQQWYSVMCIRLTVMCVDSTMRSCAWQAGCDAYEDCMSRNYVKLIEIHYMKLLKGNMW